MFFLKNRNIAIFLTIAALMLWANVGMTQAEWEKYPGNPVLDLGESGAWDDDRIFSPTVLFDGTKYQMWYSGHGTRYRIGYATSTDSIVWKKYLGNPVLDLGESGTWDDFWVHAPTVLFDGTKYQMWYSGHDGANDRIGYATSSDGIVWQRYPGNPVLDLGESGTWDDNGIFYAPSVLFDSTEYQMWYTGSDGSNYRIGYATSLYEGPPNFVVNYSRGINMISVPLDPGETWRMSDLLKHIGSEASMVIWYDKIAAKFTTFMPRFSETSPANTTVNGGEGYILIMTKAKEVTYEGEAWENVGKIPSPTIVLSDGSDVKTPIFAVTGLIKGQGGSYLDGVKVTIQNVNTGQQVTAVTGTTAGHGRYVATLGDFMGVIAAQVDDTFSINVEGSQRGFTNNNVKLKITLDDISSASVTFDFTLEPLPSRTTLLQNYPNPFNPETWLPYQLTQDAPAAISIYNAKGQLVRMLHLGNQKAGTYITQERSAYWDGRDSFGGKVASGVYFYTLRTGDFTAVRKMVLLK